MKVSNGYDYDDVLILPKPSKVNSREDVNLKVSLGEDLIYPIFSAPMKYISELPLIKKLSDLECLGILHRFNNIEQRYKDVDSLVGYNFGVAIGLQNESEIEFARYAVDCGAKLVCVDVANGYTDKLCKFIDRLSKEIFVPIMSGNVVTEEGTRNLFNAGASFIRVGIGSGQLCTTRIQTGVGQYQLSAIESCRKVKEAFIVADGGIKNSGNAVKAFACGADFVMLGSLLAQSFEVESNVVFGMASREIQQEQNMKIKSVEGKSMAVTLKRPLEDVISEFIYGIKSACTYLNCNDLKSLKENVEFTINK